MELPQYYEFYRDFLNVLSDSSIYTLEEIRTIIIRKREFTPAERAELLPSGKQSVLENRIAWASVYLFKAGLVMRPSRGKYTLTQEGKRVQKDLSIHLDNDYLLRYPSFAAFVGKHSRKKNT